MLDYERLYMHFVLLWECQHASGIFFSRKDQNIGEFKICLWEKKMVYAEVLLQ